MVWIQCFNFETTFTNPTYLHFYDESNDEEPKVEDPWVVNMGGLMTQDDTLALNVGEKSNINLPSNLKTPTHRTFMHINIVMQEILDEVKEGDVQFIDHATSLLHVVASHVQGMCFSKINETMHPSMVFHQVNDGLGTQSTK